MQTKPIYTPIPPDRETCRLLITIKKAAAQEECSENTLKTNAKARRWKAYQDHFGVTVYVLPSEIREFLKSRPLIASKYTRKGSLTATTHEKQTATSTTRFARNFMGHRRRGERARRSPDGKVLGAFHPPPMPRTRRAVFLQTMGRRPPKN